MTLRCTREDDAAINLSFVCCHCSLPPSSLSLAALCPSELEHLPVQFVVCGAVVVRFTGASAEGLLAAGGGRGRACFRACVMYHFTDLARPPSEHHFQMSCGWPRLVAVAGAALASLSSPSSSPKS